MNNPFPYSDSNKRYHTFNYFLRHHFGCKVAKVSLDAGFTCPNLDGTKGGRAAAAISSTARRAAAGILPGTFIFRWTGSLSRCGR
jgi:hypothetical protein